MPNDLCYLCNENPTTKDNFCYGCKQLICGDCAVNQNMSFGVHDPEDHLENDEDGDEENDY